MRIATYNVEWFSNLFDDEGNLLADGQWSARHDVTRKMQLEALGIVFTALDADAVMIIEAPDSHRGRDGVKALENFARSTGLRARKAVMGFINDTQQEIALLYDPDKLTAWHDPIGSPRFDQDYHIDLNTDAAPDKVRWSKPPLELGAKTASGKPLRMIGVHAKSKAPHGARNRKQEMRIAIENRRKQLAQCIWLRERIEEHLDIGESLIVMGDFNDGPGLDEYEKLFGRSGVEIVLGKENEEDVCLYDPHALALDGGFTSSRFWVSQRKKWIEAMLDFVMVSQDLREVTQNWRIWHPEKDKKIRQIPELRQALHTASDHFPVSIDIDI